MTISSLMLWLVSFILLYYLIFWLLVYVEPERKDEEYEEENVASLHGYPMVTILIPAYNERKRIIPTIQSAASLNYPKERIEIIVIDDGSKDGTYDVVSSLSRLKSNYSIKLLKKENGGKGSALNLGLKHAHGEFAAIMDADSFIEKDALMKMLPHFEDEDVGIVLPVMKVRSPASMIQRIQAVEYLVNIFYKKIMARLNCVHVAPGPFSVFRVSHLKEIGGFSETRNLAEDMEVTIRMQKANYTILQLNGVTVETIAPNSLKDLVKQRNRWYKGTVQNIVIHRDTMFNRKYGDFGMMQMPMAALSIGIVLLATFVLTLLTVKPWLRFAINLSLVNFDVFTFIRSMHFTFLLLDINAMRFVVYMIMMLLTVLLIVISHKKFRKGHNRSVIIPSLYYLLLYSFFLGVVWWQVMIEVIRRKWQVW